MDDESKMSAPLVSKKNNGREMYKLIIFWFAIIWSVFKNKIAFVSWKLFNKKALARKVRKLFFFLYGFLEIVTASRSVKSVFTKENASDGYYS